MVAPVDDQRSRLKECSASASPNFNSVAACRKLAYGPVTNVDKSATKGASVGSPMEVLKVVVRALKSVISFPDGEGIRCLCICLLQSHSLRKRLLPERANNFWHGHYNLRFAKKLTR